MEPWAQPAWQSWIPGQEGEPGGAAPSTADTPAALQVGELRPLESSEPKGAWSPGPVGDIDPEGTETGLPSLGQQAASSGPSCPRLEDEEVGAFHEVSERWRAWSERWGPLLMGMIGNPAAHLSSPGLSPSVVSNSGTICPPFFGQESQWLHFLPSVCPSDSLPICLHLAVPLPPLSLLLSLRQSVCLCLLLPESLFLGAGGYWGTWSYMVESECRESGFRGGGSVLS